MTPDEYKKAKEKSGISVPDIWCGVTGISRDRDKSFSCGRTIIPPDMALVVNAFLGELTTGAGEFLSKLKNELPNCSIELDQNSLAIDIKFPCDKAIRLRNVGVDLMNHWHVYETESKPQGAALFVRIKPFGGTKKPQWYLWRGDFTDKHEKKILQNRPNPVKRCLLEEVFRQYI